MKLTPVAKLVQSQANVRGMYERKAVSSCSFYSDDTECARGEVLGVRVPAIAGSGK